LLEGRESNTGYGGRTGAEQGQSRGGETIELRGSAATKEALAEEVAVEVG